MSLPSSIKRSSSLVLLFTIISCSSMSLAIASSSTQRMMTSNSTASHYVVDRQQIPNSSSISTIVDNETKPCLKIRYFARIFVPIFFSPFLIIGLIGNVLVIIVIAINPSMRTPTNLIILSLAVSDLLFNIVCIPATAVLLMAGGWPFYEPLCKLYFYTTYATVYFSVYAMVLMSLDRFLAVCLPFASSRLRTLRNVQIGLTVLWLAALLANIPLAINSLVVGGPSDGRSDECHTEYCTFGAVKWNSKLASYVDDPDKSRHFQMKFFIFGYLIPCLLIAGLYLALVIRLRFARASNIAQSVGSKRSKRRVTRMVVTVVAVFILSWLPTQVFALYEIYQKPENSVTLRIIQILCISLAYSNSSVNPALYAFLSSNFRNALSELMHGRRVGNQPRFTTTQ